MIVIGVAALLVVALLVTLSDDRSVRDWHPRFGPDARQSYELRLESKVNLHVPGIRSRMEQVLSGQLHMRVFEVAADGTRVGFQLSPAHYVLNGHQDPQFDKRLETPFRVTFEENGAIAAVEFPDSLSDTEQIILEEAIRALQLVAADEPQGSWTRAERHASGEYLALYQPDSEGTLQKQKTAYTQIAGADEPGSPSRIEVVSSRTVLRPATDSWLEAANLQESLRLITDTGETSQSSLEGSLRRIAAADSAAVALFAASSWRALQQQVVHDAKAPASSKPGAATVPVSVDPLEEVAETIARFEGPSGNAARTIIDLRRAIRDDPELAAALATLVREGSLESSTEALVINALERAGTESAQAALTGLATDPELRQGNRLRAIIALGGLEEPGEAAIETLGAIADERSDPQARDRSNTALLALGSSAQQLSASDPEQASFVRTELRDRIEDATDANETGMLLTAVRNTGDPELADVVEAHLDHPSGFVRSSAVRAISHVGGEDWQALVYDRLLLEESPRVRAALATSLQRVQAPSEELLRSVEGTVSTESRARTRHDMTVFLANNLADHPELRSRLAHLAVTDPSPQVRKAATMALVATSEPDEQ